MKRCLILSDVLPATAVGTSFAAVLLLASYILMVPLDSRDLNGIVYVWVGSKASHSDATVAEEIAYTMYKVSGQRLTSPGHAD